MLRAIFYARFHPERGPTVIEQYPPGSICTSSGKAQAGEGEQGQDEEEKTPFIDFSEISSYIIPPYDLCGKSLSICAAGKKDGARHRTLGWPISLENEAYSRNRFTFNVCFVLSESEEGSEKDAGLRSWMRLVRKTALFFQALELEDGILATEEGRKGSGVMKALLRGVYEQLSAYREACVRVDDVHILNLRLEKATSATPLPKIRDWEVPLLIRHLPSKREWAWDLTLARIHPHIDGVNHVAKIAEKAGVEAKLVRKAIRGLLAHDRVRMLDIFHFQAIYTLTSDFTYFVSDQEMLKECRRYITSPSAANQDKEQETPTTKDICTLYSALTSTKQSVQDFVLANQHLFDNLNTGVDIRRFITFGVLKGFLRRVHKYALLTATNPSNQTKLSGSGSGHSGSGGVGGKKSNEEAAREFDRAWRKAALSSGWATPPVEVGSLEVEGSPQKEDHDGAEEVQDDAADEEEARFMPYLDGKHCLDEVCVALRMSERKVMEKLKGRVGGREVVVFCK